MSLPPEPTHLNNHHRATLETIFRHPVSHNLTWKEVLSLLEAIGDVEERHDGKVNVTSSDATLTLDRPKHKDVTAQEVLDLRKLLASAGYQPPAT